MDCSYAPGRILTICLLVVWLPSLTFAQIVHNGNGHEKNAQQLYEIAAAHYSRDAWSMASQTFSELRSRFPDSTQARLAGFYLGESLVELKDYPAAIDAFEHYLPIADDEEKIPRSKFRIAECKFLLEQDQEAIQAMQDFVFDYPGHPLLEFALPIIAQLRLERNEPQIALRAIQMHQQEFPNSTLASQIQFDEARCMQIQGKLDDAAELYRELVKSPDFAHVDRVLFELGRIYFAENQSSQAKGWLDRLVQHFPNSEKFVSAKLLLAEIYLAENNQLEAERTLINLKPIQIDVLSANEIVLMQSRIAIKGGQSDKAVEWLENLCWNSIQPASIDEATLLRIQIAQIDQDWESVLKFAENYRAKHLREKNYFPITLAGGIASYKLRDFVAAVDQFQSLLGQIAQSDFAHFDQLSYWIALAEIGQGEYELGLTRLNQIDSFNSDESFEASIALAKATAYRASSSFDEAIPELQKYITLLPNGSDSTNARIELVEALVQTERTAEADQQLSSLESIGIDTAKQIELASQVAWIATQNKEYAIARKRYRFVIDQSVEEKNGTSSSQAFEQREQAIAGLAFVNSQDIQVDGSSELIRQIESDIRSGSESAVSSALALAANWEKAGNVKQAVSVYKTITDCWRSTEIKISVKFVAPAVLSVSRNYFDSTESDKIEARELLRELTDEFDDFENRDAAIYQLAWLQIKTGQKNEATHSFALLTRQYPDSRYCIDALFRIAKMSLDAGDSNGARKWLVQLVESKQTGEPIAFGLYQLGKIAVRDGNWIEAKNYMMRLVQQYGDTGVAAHGQYWLAESQFQLHEANASKTSFEVIVENQNQPENRRLRALMRIAQIEAAGNRWFEVEKIAATVRRDFADNSQQFQFDYLMGRCMMDRAKFQIARQYFQSVTNSPASQSSEVAAMAQWLTGETYFHQKKYEEAINEYFLVESQHAYPKWQGAALLQAAKCYELLEQKVPAGKLYRHILVNHADTEFATTAKLRLAQFNSATPVSHSNQPKK